MFAQLTLVVAASLAGPLLAAGTRGLLPAVVGELAIGALLGHTGFRVVDPGASAFPVFHALGFAMLMMTAGTHVDLRSQEMRRGAGRGTLALVAVAVVAAPAGFLVASLLGFDHPALLGVLLAGSSAAVAFPIIEENHLKGPAVSYLIAWIALADTVTVVLMPLTVEGGGRVAATLGGDAAIVAVGLLVLGAALWLRRLALVPGLVEMSRRRGWALQLRLSMVVLLLLLAVAETAGASTLVAGFLAGIILVHLGEPDRLALQISGVANGFFVAMFFVLLGAQLDLRALAGAPTAMLLAAAMALGAIAVHVAAALLTAPARRLPAGLSASAQLGLPAAAASLGLADHALPPAVAAAVVAAGCLTLLPAAFGANLLARPAGPGPE
ncbi:MAG TPA: cation:proton antiporter [Candidatus Dormibacteraeota bacterium]|jgi:Kef-type K+ transport system membrane component KefB|nr:cation:proton antiporter [Candidatus Dormibacteraeota bacterium]